MRTKHTLAFDHWIRNDFKQINTELEELYFAQVQREKVDGVGDDLKQQLLSEGNQHIKKLLNEGNTDEGFDHGFDLLGNVGFFMGACRRHELTEPSRETTSPLVEASALAMQLGASLGVTPRFASAHLETHNRAIKGLYRSFTSLHDEILFVDYNTRGVFAFTRAGDALLKVLPLGVSHPITNDLLITAKSALKDAIDSSAALFEKLDVDRFFYCVRPYYKTHRVGRNEYRGANAGDFACFNVIDMLLGLCRADDPYYSQLLVDKFLFMRPEDQLQLRDCMRRKNLLDQFLEEMDNNKVPDYLIDNAKLFLDVCELYGQTATLHHEQLVKKYIYIPAKQADLIDAKGLTASGPPLPVMLKGLKKLCDLRNAERSDEYQTSFESFLRLREGL